MPWTYHVMPQSRRRVELHKPGAEVLMNHGDLLVFTGGNIIHSMFPAEPDPAHEYRYSFLFRYTTDAMREFGPGDKARAAGHNKQYKEAVGVYARFGSRVTKPE